MFLLLLLLSSISTVLAQENAPAQGVTQYSEEVLALSERLFSELMSPFCPGRTMKDCPSSQTRELKTEIKNRLSAGESSEQIEQSLVDLYGDELRASPSASNWVGALGWLAPFMFLLVGLILLAQWLFRNVSPDSEGSEPPPST